MEQERLARLKRASPNDPEDYGERASKVSKIEVKNISQLATSAPPKSTTQACQKQSVKQTIHTLDSLSTGSRNPSSSSVTSNGMQFLEGVVRKTFVEGAPRGSDDIKLEEILQRVNNVCHAP